MQGRPFFLIKAEVLINLRFPDCLRGKYFIKKKAVAKVEVRVLLQGGGFRFDKRERVLRCLPDSF